MHVHILVEQPIEYNTMFQNYSFT